MTATALKREPGLARFTGYRVLGQEPRKIAGFSPVMAGLVPAIHALLKWRDGWWLRLHHVQSTRRRTLRRRHQRPRPPLLSTLQETERNLANKISRGGFSGAFFLQCLVAVGCTTLRSEDV